MHGYKASRRPCTVLSLIILLSQCAVQDERLSAQEQEISQLYKNVVEHRQRAQQLASYAQDAAKQLTEAQRLVDVLKAAAAAAHVPGAAINGFPSSGVDLNPAICYP